MPDEPGHPPENFLEDSITLSDTALLVLLVALKATLYKLLCITVSTTSSP